MEKDHCAVTLFDENPIRIGGFVLRGRSCEPDEDAKPNLKGWGVAFEFAEECENASPYWTADLLAYSEGREDWRSRMDQAKARTGLSHRTLINRASIGRKVTGKARELAPSITHAAVVAALDPDEQEELLAEAKAGEWSAAELTRIKKDRARKTIVVGQAPSMHTIDITVRMTIEADNPVMAQDAGWSLIKAAVKHVPHAHVVGSCSYLPALPARKLRAVK